MKYSNTSVCCIEPESGRSIRPDLGEGYQQANIAARQTDYQHNTHSLPTIQSGQIQCVIITSQVMHPGNPTLMCMASHQSCHVRFPLPLLELNNYDNDYFIQHCDRCLFIPINGLSLQFIFCGKPLFWFISNKFCSPYLYVVLGTQTSLAGNSKISLVGLTRLSGQGLTCWRSGVKQQWGFSGAGEMSSFNWAVVKGIKQLITQIKKQKEKECSNE